jgi:hypothetical protein
VMLGKVKVVREEEKEEGETTIEVVFGSKD